MSEPQRILVVDDQQEILDLTSTVLSGAGYETATSSSGGDALRQLAEEQENWHRLTAGVASVLSYT